MVVVGLFNFFVYLFNIYVILVLFIGNIVVVKLLEVMLLIVQCYVVLLDEVRLLVGVFNFV